MGRPSSMGVKWSVFSRRMSRKNIMPFKIWQTPFTSVALAPEGQADSLLFKIGNKEIVRGMAECSELMQLIDKDDSYEGLYVDLGKKSSDVLDGYFWIDKSETEQLAEPLRKIRSAANAAVEEYER